MSDSQSKLILRHLAQGKTLTALQALELFGCMALSQRCTGLRKDGWPIDSRMIELPNKKRVAEYFYRAPEQQQLEVA